MTEATAVPLASRGILQIEGRDAHTFLQGVASNDIMQVGPERAVWTAFLTPQGKFLHDLFVAEAPDGSLWIDCEGERYEDLTKRLSIYRLRAKANFVDRREDLAVVSLVGEAALGQIDLPALEGHARPLGQGVVFVDPRLGRLGARAIVPRAQLDSILREAGFALGGPEDYDRLRLRLGVPDGSRDLEVERATLIESGFDELHGISWEKGCFLGQELTARMKYRGLAKKRLVPVAIEGPVPAPGTEIRRAGKLAGEMRSATDGVGLALLRLDQIEAAEAGVLEAGEARLTPHKPDWANF